MDADFASALIVERMSLASVVGLLLAVGPRSPQYLAGQAGKSPWRVLAVHGAALAAPCRGRCRAPVARQREMFALIVAVAGGRSSPEAPPGWRLRRARRYRDEHPRGRDQLGIVAGAG